MLLRYFMRMIEYAFLVGLAGSLVVAAISFAEDLHQFFEKDRVNPLQHEQRMRRAS